LAEHLLKDGKIMTTITPGSTLTVKDTNISANPNPVPFGGIAVSCPVGMLGQDVILPASTVDEALSFPVGLATAAILCILAVTTTDLIVKVDTVSLSVPLGQPLFLYGVAAADISVSSALGGKITYTVGG
jgi:hypothetical protein